MDYLSFKTTVAAELRACYEPYGFSMAFSHEHYVAEELSDDSFIHECYEKVVNHTYTLEQGLDEALKYVIDCFLEFVVDLSGGDYEDSEIDYLKSIYANGRRTRKGNLASIGIHGSSMLSMEFLDFNDGISPDVREWDYDVCKCKLRIERVSSEHNLDNDNIDNVEKDGKDVNNVVGSEYKAYCIREYKNTQLSILLDLEPMACGQPIDSFEKAFYLAYLMIETDLPLMELEEGLRKLFPEIPQNYFLEY